MNETQVTFDLNSVDRGGWALTSHLKFWESAFRDGYSFKQKFTWSTPETSSVDKIFEEYLVYGTDCSPDNTRRDIYFRNKTNIQVMFLLTHTPNNILLEVVCNTLTELNNLEGYVTALQKILPVSPVVGDDSLNVIFSTNSLNGARLTHRQIDVNHWDVIKNNYVSEVQEKLDTLTTKFIPSKGGQLLLWHGAPGTGKTYALRSLGHAWKAWCDTYYVLDAEAFFGDAAYMLDLLLHRQYADMPYEEEIKISEKWKLLLLEDAGELLTADAKERTGQGLSRLLNTIDGLIGQGLKILILITTNENLSDLHPAIARPGRCAAEIFFEKFDKDGSKQWLETHGVASSVLGEDMFFSKDKEYSLAELYSIKEGFTGAKGSPKVTSQIGFRK